MKRHIFTALSLTLLTSSPITLNAGKNKQNKPKPMSLAAFQDSKPENPAIAEHTEKDPLALLPFSNEKSIPTDEFDKSNTQAQRAALFGAITAIQCKENKGLKQVDCSHESVRQGKIADLYASEDTDNIKVAASTATQAIATTPATLSNAFTDREQKYALKYVIAKWRLLVATNRLASTQKQLEALQKEAQSVNTDVLDLFPSSPITQSNELPDERVAQRQQDDDSDRLSVVSSVDENQSENSLAIQTNNNNNATDSASNKNIAQHGQNNSTAVDDFENISKDSSDPSTISPVTPPTQRATTIGGWSISYLFGYKYNN